MSGFRQPNGALHFHGPLSPLGSLCRLGSRIGDFNNDGMSDIVWQNTNGQAAIWLMNGVNATAMVPFTAVSTA
jgi:hypothetical protein